MRRLALVAICSAEPASALVSWTARETGSYSASSQHELQPELHLGFQPDMQRAAATAEHSLFYDYHEDGGLDLAVDDESMDDGTSRVVSTRDLSQLLQDSSDDSAPSAACLEACESVKSQCKEKACAGLEGDGQFRSCAPASAGKPRMLYAEGCSGSTWVQKMARELLSLHGFCVSPGAYEPLNPSSDVKRLFPNSTMGDAMARANDYWGEEGVTTVYKGTGALDSDYVRKKMHRHGTYAAVVWRRNALDHAVCMVRDCFSDKLGFAVDADSGNATQICFQRRKAPGADNRSFKVNLNMTNLLRRLAYMSNQGQRLGSILKASDFAGFEIITYEDLSDYQRKASGRTNATEALDRALDSWSTLLRSWGVTPNYRLIAEYLRAGRDTRDPPKPHSEMIYNYQEVRRLIEGELGNWPEFEGLLRL